MSFSSSSNCTVHIISYFFIVTTYFLFIIIIIFHRVNTYIWLTSVFWRTYVFISPRYAVQTYIYFEYH